MKHAVFYLFFLLAGSWLPAGAQAPAQTANDYVRPYPEAFQYGVNMGYYGAAWSDDSLARLAQKLGGHSVRPRLDEAFLERYGYNVRTSTFTDYVTRLGMKEITCFVENPADPHRDNTIYPGGSSPSKLFAHLYEPIWNPDGTVNANNYYAQYVYKLLLTYGDKVRFWEVVNEPDYTYSSSMDEWLTRPPTPDELVNIKAPIYHYVRMLRITYEVVKKYHPEAYVTTGGVGYSQFVDALLRYTDDPNGGGISAQYPRTAGAYLDALSFHSYPSYELHYWNNAKGGFDYTRNSDFAAAQVMVDKNKMAAVLTKYGYDGTRYPAKQLLMTETNISRRTSDDRTGSDEMQRNFGIKTLVLAQKNNIKQLYFYSLGEGTNAPPAGQSVSGADEISLMGLYENLNRDAPGAEKTTQQGRAFATTSKLLYGFTYDAARTAALALPSGTVEGAAFSKNGTYRYVLWAKAQTDNSEAASATYSFPAAWNLANVQRYEWDYATTGAKAASPAQNIALTGVPAFFSAEAAGPTAGTTARVTFTFAAPVPAGTTARIAPALYNKTRVLQFEEDDSPVVAYTDLLPLLKGGTRNGVAYPGLRFTDGCGTSKPYTAAVAINGHNTYNNSVWLDAGPNHDPSKLLWPQAQELLSNGWDIENHSDLHSAANPGQQVAALDALIADRLQGYQPTVHIVPTNYAGYPTAAFDAGYAAVSSQSQSDGLPMLNQWTDDRVALRTLPAPTTRFVYRRFNADGAAASTLRALSDALLAAGSTPSDVYLQRVFTHGLDFGVLSDWLTYTQSIAQDQLWVTTLREFAEYRRVSSQVRQTQTISGNTLTVDLDYAALSPNTRFQNLTLVVDSPGSIASISTTGAGITSSSNPTSRLVNVFRNPAAAPPTGGCAGTGTLTREQWNNVTNSGVAAIPLATPPSSTGALPQFEAATQTEFNYGARLRGYVCPPQTGAYTFWLVGDDAAELYLSPNDQPSAKTRLATCNLWTSGIHDFDRDPSQRSAPVQLVAGQRYYMEALHQQSWGPGYVSVAWQLAGGARQEPIAGANLLPFQAAASQPSSSAAALLSAAGTAPESTTRAALTIYPNPFTRQATIQVKVAQAGPITLAVYDLQGRLVRQAFAGSVGAGELRTISLDASALSAGLYLIRLQTATEVITQKVSCFN